MAPERNIVALVPAGDRGAGDPVAKVSGVSSKALAPLAGTPMIIRVLNTLQATGRVDSVVLSGPDQDVIESSPLLQEVLNKDNVSWVPAERSLAGSIQAGLARIDPAALVLITTADHAMLDTEILNYFLDRVVDSSADVNVGLVEYGLVEAAYPGVRRTVLKFSDGGYCGCNLYALNGARARDIISLWQRTQTYRKQPWRMIHGLFGFGMLAKYLSGRLNLDQAREAIMKKTGINADFIEIPFPHAGIDVDTPADLELATQILEQRS